MSYPLPTLTLLPLILGAEEKKMTLLASLQDKSGH